MSTEVHPPARLLQMGNREFYYTELDLPTNIDAIYDKIARVACIDSKGYIYDEKRKMFIIPREKRDPSMPTTIYVANVILHNVQVVLMEEPVSVVYHFVFHADFMAFHLKEGFINIYKTDDVGIWDFRYAEPKAVNFGIGRMAIGHLSYTLPMITDVKIEYIEVCQLFRSLKLATYLTESLFSLAKTCSSVKVLTVEPRAEATYYMFTEKYGFKNEGKEFVKDV